MRGVVALVPVIVASYLVKTVLTVLMRRRLPRAAAVVDQTWAWVPLVVVLIVVTVAEPVVGLLATFAMVVFLTSDRAIGSPFRPRR